MQFYTGHQLQLNPNDTIFGHSRARSVCAAVIFSAVAAGGFYIGVNGGIEIGSADFPAALGYIVGGTAALFVLLAAHLAKAAFRPENWILRYAQGSVWIKFRSYLNTHFDKEDTQALRLDPSDIEWIRLVKETVITPRPKGNRYEFNRYLDLKLSNTDTSELENHLAEERKRKATRSLTKYHDYPVTIGEEGVIRVKFNGIVPSVNQALKILGQSFPMQEQIKIKRDFTSAGQRKKEEAEKQILDLLEMGKTIEAVSLASRALGMSTTEAKKFVDGMTG